MKYKQFNMVESEKLFNNVNNLVKSGCSVYRACMMLANYDKKLCLRYQNKYRNMQKCKNNNIITIKPIDKKLTDEDINNLIMGIVGLIKKTTAYSVSEHYKGIINEYNIRLNNTLIELNKKNNLLNTALKENEMLKESKSNNLNKLLNKVKGK